MTDPTILGAIYGLLFSITWSIGTIGLKTQAGKSTPLGINFGQSLFGCVFFLLFYLITGRWNEIFTFGPYQVIALTLTVLVGYLLGEYLYLSSMKYARVSLVTSIYWTYPIITTVLAWLFLDEGLTWISLAAAAIAVTGVVLIHSALQVHGPTRIEGAISTPDNVDVGHDVSVATSCR